MFPIIFVRLENGKEIPLFHGDTIIGFGFKTPGYHLKKVRRLLNVKQRNVAEKTDHCDSTISDLERSRGNPKFYTIQSYLKALGVEFYAFVPADGLASVNEPDKSEYILVQITHEELMQIRKSA